MIDLDSLVIGPCMTAFGEPVTYSPAAGDKPFTINGVYDEAYHDPTLLDDSPGITTTMPVLGVRIADFSFWPPGQNDTLTIQRTGDVFLVKEARPDGHGWAKLMLNFAGS